MSQDKLHTKTDAALENKPETIPPVLIFSRLGRGKERMQMKGKGLYQVV